MTELTVYIEELRKANNGKEIKSIKVGKISYSKRPTEDKTEFIELNVVDVVIEFV